MANIQSMPGGAMDAPMWFNQYWTVKDDLEATNHLISNNGLRFKHYMAIPYVVGSSEADGARDWDGQDVPVENDNIVDNGFLYKYAGDVYAVFTSNNQQMRQTSLGYFNDSQAMVTFNKFYRDSDKIVTISEFDRLIPCEPPAEFRHVNFQKLHHNPSGIDHLQFMVDQMIYLGDSTGREYTEGIDFCLHQGSIKWLSSGSRPGLDPRSGKGRVISVRYTYKPSFYVKQIMHSIRTHATIDNITGEIRTQSGPIAGMIQVDFVFRDSVQPDKADLDAVITAGTTPNTRGR
jgi:hypothetical protein